MEKGMPAIERTSVHVRFWEVGQDISMSSS